MARTPLFLQYEKCSTCVKARKWLESQQIEFQSRPIVESPPSVEELRSMWQRSGLSLSKFFNTSGQSYRALGKAHIDALDDEGKLEALSKDGKLIKRPLLDAGGTVLVGFKEEAWSAWAKGARS